MEELNSPAAEPELPTTPEARAAYIKAAQTKPNLAALDRLFAAELRAHPALAEALAPYHAQSESTVVRLYANAKAAAFIKGPLLLKRTGARFIEVREDAAHDLWEIQQKKLFDLQCRWRAEQLTLPGVRHTEEFRQWEKYIDYCPWLPPITAEEVALYESYLRSDHYVPNQNWAWQDYNRFRRTIEGSDQAPDDDEANGDDGDGYKAATHRAYRSLPAWYQYHNEATGENLLLTLPDVRGEKEAYYIGITEADKEEKLAAQRARGDMAASLPWHPIFLHHDDLTPYFRQFEDPADLPRLLRWYEASREDDRRRQGYLFEATHWMEKALEHQATPWPIAAHADWRQAVIAAGMRAWGHQLAEVLTDVWQEEEQNRALGLPLTGPKIYGDRAPFAEVDWAEEETYQPKFILRGRELAGEPRDFNF